MGEMIRQRVERMTGELGLSAEQQSAIRTIFEEHAVKMKEIRDDPAPGGERAAKAQELRGMIKGRVRAVLTPEQQAKQDAVAKEREARRRNPEGKGASGGAVR